MTIDAPMRKITYYRIPGNALPALGEDEIAPYIREKIRSGEIDADFNYHAYDCAVADDAQIRIGDTLLQSKDITLEALPLSPEAILPALKAGDYVYVGTLMGEGSYTFELDAQTIDPAALVIGYADCHAMDDYDERDNAYLEALCGCLDLGSIHYAGQKIAMDETPFTAIERTGQCFRVAAEPDGGYRLEKLRDGEDTVTDMDFDELVDAAQENEIN